MMYMSDAINATLNIMTTEAKNVKSDLLIILLLVSMVRNLRQYKNISEFSITYIPDFTKNRQIQANSIMIHV